MTMTNHRKDTMPTATDRASFKLIPNTTTERNGYDDSDFLSAAWNPATGELVNVVTHSTRHAGVADYPMAGPGEIAAALIRYREMHDEAFAEMFAAVAARPDVGRKVVAVKGYRPRSAGKVGFAAGATGTVTWKGVDRYRSNSNVTHYRVGVRLDDRPDEVVYTPLDKWEATDGDEVLGPLVLPEIDTMPRDPIGKIETLKLHARLARNGYEGWR